MAKIQGTNPLSVPFKGKPHSRGKLGVVEEQMESQYGRLTVMVWAAVETDAGAICSLDKAFVFSFDGKSLEVLKRASNWSFEKVLLAPLWRISPRKAQWPQGVHGGGWGSHAG